MAENTNTFFRFRFACEECHTRKIKCYPSLDDNSEACEACRVNERKCLFSLRGKLGRPRKTNRSHSTPTNVPKTSVVEMRSSDAQTTMESPVTARSEKTSAFPTIDLQGKFADHDDDEEIMVLDTHYDEPSTLHSPTSENQRPPNMMEVFPTSSTSVKRFRKPLEHNNEIRALVHHVEKLHRVEGHDCQTHFQDPESMDSVDFPEAYKDSIPSDLSTFSHDLDFSMDDFSQVPFGQFEASSFLDLTIPQAETQRVDQNLPRQTTGDCQETLQIYGEVHRQGQVVSNKRCNLFAETDQEDVQQLIVILQRISARISALFKISSGNSRGAGDQGMAIVIFACVIQAVDNISKFVELDRKD